MWKAGLVVLALATASGLSAYGAGEPVYVTETVEGDYEYIEENDSVKYPAYRTGRNEYVYSTVPFEGWSERQCASIAAEAAVRAVEQRHGGKLDGVSGFMTTRDGRPIAGVSHTTTLNREGHVVNAPDIGYSRVKSTTPEYINVNARYEGLNWSCRVPVVVKHSLSQMD